MQFTLATVLAVLPFLTTALPNPQLPASPATASIISVPAAKRSKLADGNGSIDVGRLTAHVEQVKSKIAIRASIAMKNTGVNLLARPRSNSTATIRRELPVLQAREPVRSITRCMPITPKDGKMPVGACGHSNTLPVEPSEAVIRRDAPSPTANVNPHHPWGIGPVVLPSKVARHFSGGPGPKQGPYGDTQLPSPTPGHGHGNGGGSRPGQGSGGHGHGHPGSGGPGGEPTPTATPGHGGNQQPRPGQGSHGHGQSNSHRGPQSSVSPPRPSQSTPGHAGNGGTGSVASDPLDTDEVGAVWFGKVSVGTPPTEFTVDFDTGSSDFFVAASNCKQGCDGHTTYDTSSSSTASDAGKSFQVGFGDGSVAAGDLFQDTVSIAGLSVDQVAVGAATQYSEGFALPEFQPDGLMGLGFSAISQFRAPNPIQALADQGSLPDAVFAFKLTADGPGSELTIGGLNQELFKGDIAFAPVTQKAFWQVDMDGVNVDGQPALGKTSVIVDSGTSLVMGDADEVSQIYAAIEGSQDASDAIAPGFFTFPCSSTSTVSLSFGGKPFDMSPESFNLGTIDNGQNCVGSIVGGDLQGVSDWIVGDRFMLNTYTVFDIANAQVGFAELA
ncbi:hypothetical protein HGRIS_013706 [Hohenbuehelia grisea]|uniref:Peptidase A1 domain-containing protein n=1 Tax=Hohenbuehelia grisea TaxID=104357 RepID=A0ABR3IWE1_9AGAR